MKKITVRIENETAERLKRFSISHERTLGSVIEEALREFLSEGREKTALEGLLSVTSRSEKRIRGLRNDLETIAELLTFFVFHWFCHTQPIPESLKREAFASGKERYERFLGLFREQTISAPVLSAGHGEYEANDNDGRAE